MTPNSFSFRLVLLTFFVFLALCLNTASVYAQFDASHIRAVDASAAACGDGTTWNTAYHFLQDALTEARGDETIDEIWVKAGTYYPDQDCANPDGTGLRTSTFLVNFNNVQLLGGFDGTETLPEERDPADKITVLSGDITNPWENCAPDSGNCFQANGTPGCDNLCGGEPCPGCCELVYRAGTWPVSLNAQEREDTGQKNSRVSAELPPESYVVADSGEPCGVSHRAPTFPRKVPLYLLHASFLL